METTDMTPLLEQLEDDIDELEEVLKPVLSQALSVTAQKMPVMDKAKLHVLITYTIESLLFSYLRLHGVNAKEHPVWKELTRVKQYFDKIKALETGPEKRTMAVDKEAAGRFIKHGLVSNPTLSRRNLPHGLTDATQAGNDKVDLARAEREAKEKAMANLRAAQLAKKKASNSQKQHAEEEVSAGNNSSNQGDSGGIELEVEEMIRSEANANSSGPEAAQETPPADGTTQEKTKNQVKKERREKKRQKRQAKRSQKADHAHMAGQG